LKNLGVKAGQSVKCARLENLKKGVMTEKKDIRIFDG